MIQMARDIEKEAKKIRNGNKYIIENEGKGVFSRDVDRLFNEYTNLRHKIYNDKKDYFNDAATREELRSYIDEQFVKLVKEYDINSPVDFPGYINRKLKARVNGVFVHSTHRDRKRERLADNEGDIEELLPSDSTDIDTHVLMSFEDDDSVQQIFKGVTLSVVQKLIVGMWISGEPNQSKIVNYLSKHYKIKRTDLNEEYNELKEFLEYRLKTDKKGH